MDTAVICDRNILDIFPKTHIETFNLYGRDINIALLNINYDEYLNKEIPETSILVKIKSFSCNYRDKSLILTYSDICKHKSKEGKYFYSPFGSEFVAEVLKVGEKVTSLNIGDKVIPNMAYPFRDKDKLGGVISNFASQRIQIFEENQLLKIKEGMPEMVAAAFTLGSQTAYSMIRKADIKGGENILITAATSNTSLCLISALNNENVNIYAITSSIEYEADLIKLGVKKVIPYNNISDNNKELTSIKPDIVLDPFFDIYFDKLIKHINVNGKYIYCGFYNQNILYPSLTTKKSFEVTFAEFLSYSIKKNITIIANCLGTTNDLLKALDFFYEGKYSPVIYNKNTSISLMSFLETSFHKKKKFGKVVFSYN